MTKNISVTHLLFGALLLLFSGMTVSCKKLLSIPGAPPGQIPASQVFTDSADALSGVAGIYAIVQTFEFNMELYLGLTSDELATSVTYIPDYTEFYTGRVEAANGSVSSIWTTAYSTLYQINACLEGLNGSSSLSSAFRQQLMGEVRVLRSFYYFQLVNLYGGVPPETSTDYKVNAVMPRTTVDSIYGLMLSDLTSASQLLTPLYPSPGHIRPNQYVAWSLLARTYLYKGQWTQAADMASSVINTGLYSLVPNLNNVFLDGSSEAIWQLPPSSYSIQTLQASSYVPYSSSYVPSFFMTDFQLNAFETGDARKTNWLGISTVAVNGTSVNYYYPYKFKNRTLTAATKEDNMLMRLGELYLVRAEALAQQNKLDSARSDLNQVRSRAGLAPSTATSQADVLKAILHERQVELFTEWASRWYDLKRSGTIDAVLGSEKSAWQPFQALYPIPSSEILSNPFLVQNPNY